MSSARSNASARQRRAQVDKSTYNNHQPQQQQLQQQGNQPQVNPKLSVSDAIGLITLRLGRLENMVQNNNTITNDGSSTDLDTMKHVLGRITKLEQDFKVSDNQSNTNILNNMESINLKINEFSGKQQDFANDILAIKQKMDSNKNNVNYNDSSTLEKVNHLIETQEQFNKDIICLKDECSNINKLMITLQSFTMETNQKLTNMIFHPDNETIIKESSENINDSNNTDLDNNSISNTDFTRLIINVEEEETDTNIVFSDKETTETTEINDTSKNDSDTELSVNMFSGAKKKRNKKEK